MAKNKQLVKKSILAPNDLIGSVNEIILATPDNDSSLKLLQAGLVIEKGGIPRVLFTVYDGNRTPIMSTPNLIDAVSRYNSLPDTVDKPEPVGEEEKV